MALHHLRNVYKHCLLKTINKTPKCPLEKFAEWSRGQTEFTTPYEEMNPEELNKCLQKFYVAARKKAGNYYNRKSLTAIRASIDRHLRRAPLSKPFSIVSDSQFKEANKTLSNFLKYLSNNGEISGTKHKGAVTREVVREKRACSCQLTPSVEAYVDRLVLQHPFPGKAGTRKPG